MKYTIRHLKVGWKSKDFKKVVQSVINEWTEAGWEFHDIKVSSDSENCLLIFKEKYVINI